MSTSSNALVQKIRAKYPGEYDDLSDGELTSKVLAKYPEYSDLAGQKVTPQTTLNKTTGISAQPAPTGIMNRVENFASNALNDLKYGTNTGPVGNAMQQAGAKGLYVGSQGQVPGASQSPGDLLGSPLLGAAQTLQGVAQSYQPGKILQGVGNTIGGVLKASTIPGLVVAPEGVNAAEAALPSSRIAAASQKFQELRGAMGENTVHMTDKLGHALSEIKESVDTGTTLPPVINKFVTRISDTEQPPLTYAEARNFYSNVSDLAASEKMALNRKGQRLLLMFKNALGESIADSAQNAGNLDKYQSAMQGFARGMSARAKAEVATDIAKKAAVATLLGGMGAAGYEGVKKIWNAK